ncbi:hypothetical protein [Sulfuriferula nivalis]|uniref:Uncharacterized protein n=1 Tax=Sulfuriferula nivalis TaxID=2675298 RepID=A0A809RL45_9PROT|nr:hypothetical protein [Sulfuriferula nivalis]BBO99500.1 hypothetical protein SFSGTM_02090 [Sulfuriferula nivalis]
MINCDIDKNIRELVREMANVAENDKRDVLNGLLAEDHDCPEADAIKAAIRAIELMRRHRCALERPTEELIVESFMHAFVTESNVEQILQNLLNKQFPPYSENDYEYEREMSGGDC